MKLPSEIKIEWVQENGGEKVSEEIVDPGIDGGSWNLYCEIYEMPNGQRYAFDCQGEREGERTEYECMEILPK